MAQPLRGRLATPAQLALGVATCLVLLLALGGSAEAVEPTPVFGLSEFTNNAKDAAGNDETQAAGHPVSATTSFRFNGYEPTGLGELPVEDAKEIDTILPAGFIGNPRAVPQCPRMALVRLAEPTCPVSTAIGYVEVTITAGNPGGFTLRPVPIYNLMPARGQPVLFAFPQTGPVFSIGGELRDDSDYGITLRAFAPQTPKVLGMSATFCGYGVEKTGTVFLPVTKCRLPSDPLANAVPLLTNPSDCSAPPPVTTLRVNSWQHPGLTDSRDAYSTNPPSPVTGCDKLHFAAAADVALANAQADTPASYSVDLRLPQKDDHEAPGTSPLKDAVVTLPEGVTLNTASAAGLRGCTDAQFGEHDGVAANCPDASKVGSVELTTPVLDHEVSGGIYLRQPDPNATRADGLFTIFLDVEDPASGVIVKLRGQVVPDARTGQLTTTFTDAPQLPVSDLRVSFKGGSHAPLANPTTCGAKTMTTTLTPWSAVGNPSQIATPSDQLTIDSGPNGSACVTTPEQRPFGPGLSAGSRSVLSGSPTDFDLRLTRNDGEQEIGAVDAVLPPGLTAKLAGVPYCPQGAIEVAEQVRGRAELANSSCPAASQVATLQTGAGAGPSPYYASGKAYLAGPYKGAPVSMVFITPAAAGPLDIGNVVVRAALYVNPVTAQVTVRSDPIPEILEGAPLRLRDIRVHVDRPDFVRNPTSCDRFSIAMSISGSSGALASPANPFQVGECATLAFKPKLALKLLGPTHRSAHPRLRATLRPRRGDANISRATLTLPKTEFLENAHIGAICTGVRYVAGTCPASSIYGHAKAWSPLLEEPLEGPVYLRSSSRKLPDLVASLGGQIHVDLAGHIDSVRARIRSTFEAIPDVPVSKFVLTMQGGRKGLLVNNTDLCRTKPQATVKLTAQNGRTHDFNPVVKVDCGKK